MRFVQHNDRVLAHVGVDKTFSLKHAVRHVLDAGFGAGAILETDGVTDFLTQPTTDFLRYTLGDGHGCDTSGLCASNPSLVSEACLSQVLCHLGRLPGTGVADYDEDWMLQQRQIIILRGRQNDAYLANGLEKWVAQLVDR